MKATQEFAKFIVDVSYTDFPEKTLQFAKDLALKCIAGMAAGSEEPVGRKVTRYVKWQGGPPESGVIGGGFRVPAENAAFALGTFAHASELEDDQWPGAASTISIFPVILPLAEKLKLSGRQVLTSIITGHEVQGRLMLATDPRAIAMGLATISYYGALGATATAAKAMELSIAETTNALSLAASHASGLVVQTGTMAHLLETGICTRAGVVSASLAKEGVDGQADVLENPRGLLSILGENGCDMKALTENLGKPPFYLHRISLKKYPCCFITHRQIDALKSLLEDHRIKYDQVERVDVEVNAIDATICNREATTVQASKFSWAHTLAAVMLEGTIGLDTFVEENLVDPKWREARKKVNIIIRPADGVPLLGGNTLVTVVTKGGKKLSREQAEAIGSPTSPISTDQVVELYKEFTKGILPAGQVDRTIDMILNLEKLRDMSELMDILTFRHELR